MKREDTSGVLWFVAGVALGATVALLYAPQSGEETRRLLGDKAREGRDLLAEHGRDLYDKGRQIADEAAELFEDGRKILQS